MVLNLCVCGSRVKYKSGACGELAGVSDGFVERAVFAEGIYTNVFY